MTAQAFVILLPVSVWEHFKVTLKACQRFFFFSGGRRLATCSTDQTVRIWDISDPRLPKLTRTYRGHQSWVAQLALAPDQKTLISGAIGEVIAWDTEVENVIPAVIHLESMIGQSWSFTQGGEALVGVEPDGVVRRTGKTFENRTLLIGKDELFQEPKYNFSENGEFLAVGSNEGSMMLFNLENGQSYQRKVGLGDCCWGGL